MAKKKKKDRILTNDTQKVEEVVDKVEMPEPNSPMELVSDEDLVDAQTKAIEEFPADNFELIPTVKNTVLEVMRLEKGAKLPQYASDGAGAMDFSANSLRSEVVEGETVLTYGTGCAVAIPKGFIGLIAARSSGHKIGLTLVNGVGFIDSDYRGEVMVKFYTHGSHTRYKIGDRICQMTIVPIASMPMIEVGELDETVRGTGGFGSTGDQ
tara:strand:+ start:14193 stop:14822 length:630 start_codon:yes stop_codon:yes gene_type:complete